MPFKNKERSLEWRKSKVGKACIDRWQYSLKGQKSIKRSTGKRRTLLYHYLNEIKKKQCKDCKHKFPLECLDFHHIKGKKKFCVSGGLFQHSLGKVLKEIKKCILVCANCHRIRTRKERQAKERKSLC